MTSEDKDGVTFPSLGKQINSHSKSAPSYSFIKAGRDQREKMFITKEHIKIQMQGREGALGTYTIPRNLGGPSVGFSRSPSSVLQLGQSIDEGDDGYEYHPESQHIKYRRDPTMIIGKEPRGKLKDAFLMRNHSAAFFSRDSPGPAAVGEAYGPKIGFTKPRIGRDYTILGKLEMNWNKCGDTPDEVGAGYYERKDNSFGKQFLSKRRNQNVHLFPKGPKFAKGGKFQDFDGDAAKSAFGKQALSKNRSMPSVGFSKNSRDQWGRVTICRTKLDEGPKAAMPRMICSMPAF